MSGLFPDLENDIFISYRQNDNINDGWVTDFVNNLRKELKSTVKEKLTIYFDTNPCDGLNEQDSVEKSLANKLRSLIFIPVLSRTYCDITSFAWKNELIAFADLSKSDIYGRDVKLANGNVVSRILPVRIHELDPSDISLIQNVLDSPPRSIDFCFRGFGVNRPLRPDDQTEGNFSGLIYRNQLNKLANTISEILQSARHPQKSENLSGVAKLSRQPASAVKSIAVLPFVNMSNDPGQEYFSDGISEEIINTLVQMPDLKIAGRTSAFSFKNKNEDLRSIGEKLNVTNILEGSVRKSGSRVRITCQLVEASTGFHLWSQKFDRDLNDIFIIQDEIARSIVENLQLTLSGKPVMPKERPHTHDVEAYQLYLKGMSFFYKRGLHMFDGIKCFEEALKIDPDYALALVGMADSYTMLCGHSYLPPEEARSKATQAAEKALRIEPDLAEAHNAAAVIAELFEWNFPKAESLYLKALELKPSYLQARCWYSLFFLLYIKHDVEGAIKHAKIAIGNDPLSFYPHTILSNVLSLTGFHKEAVEAGNRAIELDKDSFSAWQISATADRYADNFKEPIMKYRHAIDISGRHNWAIYSLLNTLMDKSDFRNVTEAGHLYMELIAKSKTGYVSPSILAIASAATNKAGEAVRYLREAIDRHDPYIVSSLSFYVFKLEPFLNIHEMHELLDSIGLSVVSFSG